ncbi:hypothetical protein JOE40_004126 [Arthrobacter sp. PvP102]|uniref:hypothetical protein n=1 Tax=unclassified Arthrobacter TaxID=235627 RepID=UPI001AE33D48|nr:MULTISPECIES: hypothetical protein [unclassified Arthrobacter]MBP1234483.1 hypothetical protein [Arthrobacter sp. PvP103]MBP1239617.1 hypothetical protein [Arthrobacter sp. PvP102]
MTIRSSRAAPADIARTLGLPAAAVEGPATFFADFTATRGGRSGTRSARREPERGRFRLAPGSALPGYCFSGPAALDAVDALAGPGLAAQLSGSAPRTSPPIPVACDTGVPVVTAGLLGGAQPWSVCPGVAASANPEDVLAEVETAV